MRVLIVEDNLIIAMMIEDAVLDCGHEALEPAMNYKEVEARQEAAEADIALIDYDLGSGKTGAEVAALLHDRFGCLCIFLTGNADLARNRTTHAIGVMEKPIMPADIEVLLKAAEEHRRGETPSWPASFQAFG